MRPFSYESLVLPVFCEGHFLGDDSCPNDRMGLELVNGLAGERKYEVADDCPLANSRLADGQRYKRRVIIWGGPGIGRNDVRVDLHFTLPR